jgi:hypothetical protein
MDETRKIVDNRSIRLTMGGAQIRKQEVMMVSQAISDRCRQLALDSRAQYESNHGIPPQIEGPNQAEITNYFTTDWMAMCQEGAALEDKHTCHQIWLDSFFAMITVGGT